MDLCPIHNHHKSLLNKIYPNFNYYPHWKISDIAIINLYAGCFRYHRFGESVISKMFSDYYTRNKE